MSDQMALEAKKRVEVARKQRDELGFETGDQPNLSLAQVVWILSFATHGDVARATQEADASDADVIVWMADDGFRNIFDNMLGNKREGVKQIASQLLPATLLELSKIMLTGSNKEKLTAAKLHMQMQGLLITNAAPVDKGALEALREEIMRPRPVIRTLPSGTS